MGHGVAYFLVWSIMMCRAQLSRHSLLQNGNTAFHDACHVGELSVVEFLAKECKVNLEAINEVIHCVRAPITIFQIQPPIMLLLLLIASLLMLQLFCRMAKLRFMWFAQVEM